MLGREKGCRRRKYDAHCDSPVVEQAKAERGSKGVDEGTGDVLVEHHKEQHTALPVVAQHPPLCLQGQPATSALLVLDFVCACLHQAWLWLVGMVSLDARIRVQTAHRRTLCAVL